MTRSENNSQHSGDEHREGKGHSLFAAANAAVTDIIQRNQGILQVDQGAVFPLRTSEVEIGNSVRLERRRKRGSFDWDWLQVSIETLDSRTGITPLTTYFKLPGTPVCEYIVDDEKPIDDYLSDLRANFALSSQAVALTDWELKERIRGITRRMPEGTIDAIEIPESSDMFAAQDKNSTFFNGFFDAIRVFPTTTTVNFVRGDTEHSVIYRASFDNLPATIDLSKIAETQFTEDIIQSNIKACTYCEDPHMNRFHRETLFLSDSKDPEIRQTVLTLQSVAQSDDKRVNSDKSQQEGFLMKGIVELVSLAKSL